MVDDPPFVDAPDKALTVQLSIPLSVVVEPEPAEAPLRVMYPNRIGAPPAEKSGVAGPPPAAREKFDGNNAA